MDELVCVGVVVPCADRDGCDDVEDGGDEGGAEHRAMPQTGVCDSDVGRTDRAPEPSSDNQDPADDEGVAVAWYGPGHDAMGQSVAVHADTWEDGHGPTGAARSACVEIRRRGEVGWRQERAGSIHGLRLVSTAWWRESSG